MPLPVRHRIAFALLSIGFVACGKPAPPPSLPYWEMLADDAPPRPLNEEVPPPGRSDVVWTSGYWYRDYDGYRWVRGSYIVVPGKGWVWQRAGWVKTPRGYVLHSGRWVRRGSAYDREIHYVYSAPTHTESDVYRAVEPELVDELEDQPPEPSPAAEPAAASEPAAAPEPAVSEPSAPASAQPPQP